MNEHNPNRHELQPDDALRMMRLSEEVRGRLLEMALITARALGVELGRGPVIKFVPHDGSKSETAVQDDAGAGDNWMEITQAPDGSSVCYGVIDGHAFAESPCGAG